MNELTEMAMDQELQTAYEPFQGMPQPQQNRVVAPLTPLLSLVNAVVQADEELSRSYALTKVPKRLQSDLDELRDHRTRLLNRFRRGAAVVDTTYGARHVYSRIAQTLTLGRPCAQRMTAPRSSATVVF